MEDNDGWDMSGNLWLIKPYESVFMHVASIVDLKNVWCNFANHTFVVIKNVWPCSVPSWIILKDEVSIPQNVVFSDYWTRHSDSYIVKLWIELQIQTTTVILSKCELNRRFKLERAKKSLPLIEGEGSHLSWARSHLMKISGGKQQGFANLLNMHSPSISLTKKCRLN